MTPGQNEITAEFAAEDLTPGIEPEAAEPGPLLALTFAAKTDLGRIRENNEDKFDWWEPSDAALLAARGRLYCVADGMGGHAAGQIAAEMALRSVGGTYYSGTRGTPEEALKRAIVQANSLVFDTARAVPSRNGMGCTIVAVAIVGGDAVIAWAGDSRIYLVRNSQARQITEDHSWVAEQVRAGILSLEEAANSRYRNVITRCLGPEANVVPDVGREMVEPGDVVVLCSDGLTGAVKDEEIARIAASTPPSFACQALIDLANDRGGPDNITVAAIRIDGEPEPSDVAANAAASEEPADSSARRRGWFRR